VGSVGQDSAQGCNNQQLGTRLTFEGLHSSLWAAGCGFGDSLTAVLCWRWLCSAV